jgi:hypothetical protein
MGLSRRQFTREFKMAVRWVENGSPTAEAARAFEVRPCPAAVATQVPAGPDNAFSTTRVTRAAPALPKTAFQSALGVYLAGEGRTPGNSGGSRS